jgi:oxygen-independent coproporphyrinogen-3 oxidase
VEPSELPFEFLMNSLRLREGFRPETFVQTTGLPEDALEPELTDCLEQGLLERHGGSVRCSERGYDFLDNILQRFLKP